MKKTNFVVAFWLILAIVSFCVFLFNFHSLWQAISYLLIPVADSVEDYYDADSNIRDLITAIPMIIIVITSFTISLKQGLKVYKGL